VLFSNLNFTEMKKRIFSLSVFAAVLIMSSCSKDFDESQTTAVSSSGKAIKFEVWTNKQTRAATQAAGVTDFSLLATDTTAATAADQVLIDGVAVGGSNAAGWTYTPIAYWPEAVTVNFFAFSPGLAPGITGSKAALVGQNDKTAGQPTIEYTLQTNLSDQKDLLVSRRSSAYGTGSDGTIGVPLTFRHALSRVKFQAKSESTMPFKVTNIKLKNIKGKATLDLNNVPKDAVAFPYPKDSAEINTVGYQTHWVPDGSTVVDLEIATFTTPDVPGDGNWHDIVGDDDALYVIPQENTASSMDSATVVDASFGTLNEFYIEITYETVPGGSKMPKSITYAVPVPAIVGNAYKSSIAFEMERQYTFRFELTGDKPIKLAPVKVNAYNDATPDELPLSLQFAGSNIYYDTIAKHLTFDDHDVTAREHYQGVYFKWGSLTGISPVGNYSVNTTVIYPKGGEASLATVNWGGLPIVSSDPGAPYKRDVKYLTTTAHDTINGVGDICKYLTEKGWAPKGKRWRMPTSAEFGKSTEYTREPATGGFAYLGAAVSTAGTDSIGSGWRYNGAFFPASGTRGNSTGTLTNLSSNGTYWSSSPASDANGFTLVSGSSAVDPMYYSTSRTNGFAIRCVVE
jgi:hypothetical protein